MHSIEKVTNNQINRFEKFSFDIEMLLTNGETAQFTVSTPYEKRIAGSSSIAQEYLLKLNGKTLSSGNICNTRTVGSSYSFKMEIDRSYLGKSDPSGIGFSLELKFDAPRKSSVKISAQAEIETSGSITTKSSSHPALNGYFSDEESPNNATKLAATSEEIISLDQYLIEARRIKVRADRDTPISDFSNTIVGLWKHIPEMVESLVDVAREKVSRLSPRSKGILNVMLECVTEDATERAEAALGMINSPIIPMSFSADLDNEFSGQIQEQDQLFTNLRKRLSELADELNLEVQFHMVDIDMDESNYRNSELKWKKTINHTLKIFLTDSNNGEQFLSRIHSAVNEELEASKQFNRARETHVLTQLQNWGLEKSDNAVNFLVMGAAHAPILRQLPKSHPIVAIWPSSEVNKLPSKARRLLSQPNTVATLAESDYDNNGQLGLAPALRYTLYNILSQYLTFNKFENTESPVGALSARYISEKLTNSALLRVFNKVSALSTESSPKERVRAVESAILDELGIKNTPKGFSIAINQYVLAKLQHEPDKRMVPRLRASSRKN
jgi:hypothetical protein